MVNDKHTIQELEKIRVDCMYGKKKHYNARDRYLAYDRRMGVILVILTAFMGTSVFYFIAESKFLLAKIIVGVLTVIVPILIVLQRFFAFEKRALTYKITADKYLWLMKKAQRLISYYRDGNKPIKEIIEEIELLCREIELVQKDEPEMSPKDYEKARKGVKKGEEAYTEVERQV